MFRQAARKDPPENLGDGGVPYTDNFTVREGAVTSDLEPEDLLGGDMRLAKGMSGGPVLSESNSVVGVIKGGRQGADGYDYFIPSSSFRSLVASVGGHYADSICQVAAASQTGSIANEAVDGQIKHSYPVRHTRDKHNSLNKTSDPYTQMALPRDGYIFKKAWFEEKNKYEARSIEAKVIDNGKKAILTFRLFSGLAYDPWKGVLEGELVTLQEPEPGAQLTTSQQIQFTTE